MVAFVFPPDVQARLNELPPVMDEADFVAAYNAILADAPAPRLVAL